VQRKVKPASEPGLAEVASPLLGIFYRAPKPGEPPFIEVGSKVGEDTVVGIIEVMKLMNSVHAGVKGEIVEILAENEALVEYDEILLRVRPGA
jgi:acetyl-CoA carboxylase biotin carboxyl carrier protein